MADRTSLQFIGYAFGAVTAAVMAMAVIVVLSMDHDFAEPPGSAIVLTSSAG